MKNNIKYANSKKKRYIPKNIKGYIYKVANNVNNLVYIGQTTKQNPNERWQQHQNDAINGSSTLFHKSMLAIGIEHFKFEIIETCTSDILDVRERYWIAYYDSFNNGYNSTIGGQDYAFGKDAIPILAYNAETGIFVKEYFSIKQAVKELNLSTGAASSISKRLDKNGHQAYGYIWLRKTEKFFKKISSITEYKELKWNLKMNKTITFVKEEMKVKPIKIIKNMIKNNTFVSWKVFKKYIYENDKNFYDFIQQKERIEQRGLVVLNILTHKANFFSSKKEAGSYLKYSKGTIENHYYDSSLIDNKLLILSSTRYFDLIKCNKLKEYIENVKYKAISFVVIDGKTENIYFFKTYTQITNHFHIQSRAIKNAVNNKYGCYHPIQGPNQHLIIISIQHYEKIINEGLHKFIQSQLAIDLRKELQIKGIKKSKETLNG